MAQSAGGIQGKTAVNFANARIPVHPCFPCKHPLRKKSNKIQNYSSKPKIMNAKSDEDMGSKKQEAIGETFQKKT